MFVVKCFPVLYCTQKRVSGLQHCLVWFSDDSFAQRLGTSTQIGFIIKPNNMSRSLMDSGILTDYNNFWAHYIL